MCRCCTIPSVCTARPTAPAIGIGHSASSSVHQQTCPLPLSSLYGSIGSSNEYQTSGDGSTTSVPVEPLSLPSSAGPCVVPPSSSSASTSATVSSSGASRLEPPFDVVVASS